MVKEKLTKNIEETLNKDDRFSGTPGEEYELLLMAYPHYEELQNTVGQSIKETFAESDAKELNILEIGCGTGITSKVLLDSDQRVKLAALDNEEIMLNQAKEKLTDYKKERVNFVLDDVLHYIENLPDNSLDSVASVLVLHNFKKEFRKKVIEQVYRVLKPGGLFVNGDKYALDDDAMHRKSYEDQVKMFDKYDAIGRSDYKEHWINHYKEDDHVGVIFREAEAKETLKELGFKDIKVIYRQMMEATIQAIK